VCGECGGAFELSARRARVHRNEGNARRCRDCRSIHSQVVVTEALRKWWLDRFTVDEIRAMGEELEV
jgi:hypothetical protein